MKDYEDEAFDELEKAQQRNVATGVTNGSKTETNSTLSALKLALEALNKLRDFPGAFDECLAATKALRAAIAMEPAPVQKPVAQCAEEAPYIGHDCDPAFPDSMKVFCPACCTKFRAIPKNVQKLMLDAGFEPPFITPPAAQPAPVQEPMTDTDEAAHGIKE